MKRSRATVILCSMVMGPVLLTVLGLHLGDHPDLVRRLGAWWSGAEYLGLEGVELQRTSNDCGPSALKMVCDYYGISTTGEDLSKAMKIVRRGVTLRQLEKIAVEMGLQCEAKSIPFSTLNTRPEPTIVLLRSQHFIVVDHMDSANFVYVRDPSLGRLKYSAKVFLNSWTGLALVFYTKRPESVFYQDVLRNWRLAWQEWFLPSWSSYREKGGQYAKT